MFASGTQARTVSTAVLGASTSIVQHPSLIAGVVLVNKRRSHRSLAPSTTTTYLSEPSDVWMPRQSAATILPTGPSIIPSPRQGSLQQTRDSRLAHHLTLALTSNTSQRTAVGLAAAAQLQ